MKFNLTLIDGTQLNDIILSTTHDDMSIGELHDEEDFYSWIRSNKNPSSKIMYFCGRYVQIWLCVIRLWGLELQQLWH